MFLIILENKLIKMYEENKMTDKTNIESKIFKSKDERWIIHKTIITDIKSANYYKKILNINELPTEKEDV